MKNSKGMIILLVALAALTLVVVVGLFFFYKDQPKPAPVATTPTTPVTTPATLPDAFDPVEWTRNPQTTAQSPGSSPTNSTGETGFTVTLPQETAPTAVGQLPTTPGVSFPGETGESKPSTVTSTPVTTTKSPATAPTATTTKTVKPTVKTVKVTEFWIQVGSFKDRYQAENTAKSLEGQGLKGTLSTASVNGQAVVRVRVGPYANEAEASKFLAWLKPVAEFSGSYITKVVATRAP